MALLLSTCPYLSCTHISYYAWLELCLKRTRIDKEWLPNIEDGI